MLARRHRLYVIRHCDTKQLLRHLPAFESLGASLGGELPRLLRLIGCCTFCSLSLLTYFISSQYYYTGNVLFRQLRKNCVLRIRLFHSLVYLTSYVTYFWQCSESEPFRIEWVVGYRTTIMVRIELVFVVTYEQQRSVSVSTTWYGVIFIFILFCLCLYLYIVMYKAPHHPQLRGRRTARRSAWKPQITANQPQITANQHNVILKPPHITPGKPQITADQHNVILKPPQITGIYRVVQKIGTIKLAL